MAGMIAQKIGQDSLIFFATINPVGVLGFFFHLTAGLSDAERRTIARRAVLYAALVLGSSVFLGQVLLEAMHVRIASFQVAGGSILFLFALQMIFGHQQEAKAARGEDPAIFPLAMPLIASPEAILAAVLLTDNNVYPIHVQMIDMGLLLGILLFTYLILVGSSRIARLLGKGGMALLVQATGLILASLAVEIVAQGLAALQAANGAAAVHTRW